MKSQRTSKIILLTCVCLFVAALAWCGVYFYKDAAHTGSLTFAGKRARTADLTCVVAASDGKSLFLGSMAPRFTVYDTESGNMYDFPLPAYTAGYNTYDILQTGPLSYLVSKRNCGVLHVTYALGEDGHPVIRRCVRIAAPAAPIPDKHTHYSAYSLVDVDSAIVIGSSNGLLYLDKSKLGASPADTLEYASFVPQLKHFASGKQQFAQEAVFVIDDTLTTVTDHGIYRMATDGLGVKDADFQIVDGEMRCYDAAIAGDSIAVLWSPDNGTDSRCVTLFARDGRRGSTRDVPTSVTRLGMYGDTLRTFAGEGDFNCFRASATLDGLFYYIKDGELNTSDPSAGPLYNDEQIVFADNGYAFSNKAGLWDISKPEPKFLGTLKGVSGIRDISVSGKTMYLAVTDGIYSVSLTDRLLPYDRTARIVERNRNKSSDRFESVYAVGDTLLIGSRNGLHAYDISNKAEVKYAMKRLNLLMESPYISRISRNDDGSFLLKTLNHGVWTLKSLSDSEATQTTAAMPDIEGTAVVLPARPVLSWGKISENAILIVLAIFALLGVFATVLYVIKSRADGRLASLTRHLSDVQRISDERQKQLEQAEEIRRQLESDYQNALLAKKEEMSIELKSVCDTVENCITQLGSDNEMADFLRVRLDKIRGHIESKEIGRLPEAAEIYREIHSFCEYTINHAYNSPYVKNEEERKKITGIWKEPFDAYVKEVNDLPKPENQSLKTRLDWLVEFSPIRGKLMKSTLSAIDNLVNEAADNDGDYSSAKIAKLWDEVILPAGNTGSGTSVARGKIEDVKDKAIRERTLVLTTITFFGDTTPDIDGNPIRHHRNAMIRFVNKGQNGTVFTFWADQLSKDALRFGNAATPLTIADLMWQIYISLQEHPLKTITDEHGNQTDLTLPIGVCHEFCRKNKIEPPDYIAYMVENRKKGRTPKKR